MVGGAEGDIENSLHSFSMAVVINGLMLVTQLFTYGVLVWHKRTSAISAPKLLHAERPSRYHALWGWAVKAWHRRRRLYKEDLDATVVLRVCVLGIKFSAAGSVLSSILIPIYSAGRGDTEGFNNFHLSNLEHNSERFWVIIVAAYILAGLFLHLVAVEWQNFLVLRKQHFYRLACGSFGASAAQAQRSILVELVPQNRRAQDGSGVRRFFEEELFPEHGVQCCVLHADTRQLHKDPAALLRGAGLTTVLRLRQVLGLDHAAECIQLAVSDGPSSTTCVLGDACTMLPDQAVDTDASQKPLDHQSLEIHFGCGSANQNVTTDGHSDKGESAGCAAACLESFESALQASIELVTGVIKRTWQAAEVVQDLSIGEAGSQTAFVTLHCVADRIIAEQLILSHSGCWQARAAPESRDIIWKNAAVPLRQQLTRTLLFDVGLALGLVFWSAPVGSLQVWTSLEEPNGQRSSFWSESSLGVLCYTFLREYLPVLTLLALQYALPGVIRFIAVEYVGYKVNSEITQKVLKWNLKYQFVTLYITIVSGTVSLSLHDQLGEVLQTPPTLFEILREEVPQVAGYFVNYVCARVGITVPLLLFFPVLSQLRAQRAAHKRGIERKGGSGTAIPIVHVHPDFATECSTLGIVLVLGLTYSVIAPAIMPICLVFFALAFVVYCWLFSYVYTPEFDCAGNCWYELERHAMLGLLLGTLSLAALASAFVGFDSIAFHALLVLSALVIAASVYFHRTFAVPSRYISLEDACWVDRSCDESMRSMISEDYYIDPIIMGAGQRDADVTNRETATVPTEEPLPGRSSANQEEDLSSGKHHAGGSTEVNEECAASTGVTPQGSWLCGLAGCLARQQRGGTGAFVTCWVGP